MQINKYFACFLSFLIFSCTSENNVRTYRLQKTNVTKEVKLKESKVQESRELSWVTPDSWNPSEGSSMRLASFSVPYSKGIGDLSVIKLSGSGGGLESNVNRWRRQLNLSPLNIDQIEKSITMMEGNLGKYGLLEIVNENDAAAFICAIFSLDESTIFVKLSLRPAGITEVEDDFITFCSSLNFSN